MPVHQVAEHVGELVDEMTGNLSPKALKEPEVQPEQLYLQTASLTLLVCSLNEILPDL